VRLIVNPIACAGHGACAELIPELIELDEWGYPVIGQNQVPDELERQARRAASSCPALALKLQKTPDHERDLGSDPSARPGLFTR
jgi:ferredoxin